MGEVFRARDERLERDVAIKVLPAEVAGDSGRLARFDREVKTLARLSHPNILAIHEFGTDEDIVFAVTELLEGETLRARLGQRPMTLQQALEAGASIADGLAAAHDQGVVHRDIKPSNIFLSTNGVVKILDFGLARVEPAKPERAEDTSEQTTFTQTGAVMGTPGYMSPEQVKGRIVDGRSDIFSFGCMLYEMVTGLSPFKRETSVETMTAILNEEPPEVDAGTELNRLLCRCLNKNPALRFQSATDLAYALRSLLESTPSGGTANAVTDVGPVRSRGRRAAWFAGLGACLVAVTVGIVMLTTRNTSQPPAFEQKSVAVLPFANMTADPEQEYFCDGMAEEIINALAQVSGLRVVARTSAFSFKGRNEDIREIGRRLNVGAVVEGSVRKVDDRLRITAQLIDTESGLHLWSERFDRKLEDVFEIQDEISLAVVDTLEVELLGSERAAVVRRPTDNLDAYNACLRGWFHWNKLTPEGYMRSYEYFNEAIALDPDLAWAYQGLAAWYSTQAWWGELSSEAWVAAVTPLVETVLELDESYLTHQVPAYFDAFIKWDWAAADEGHRRALELGPNVANLHMNYALTLIVRERFDEALSHLQTTLELDPLSPLWTTWASAWLTYAGRNDEALAGLEKAVEMHPYHWMPRFCLSFSQAKVSRLDEARANAEIAVEMSGGLSRTIAQLAFVCYRMGDNSRGDELFELLEQRARQTWVSPTILGWLHLVRGEVEEAFDRLEEAAQRKDPLVTTYRIDSYVPIPPHPRDDALRERLGLPP